MKVQNKVIVVTGAGGGIGRELVLHLLSKGARVVAIDVNETALQETAAKVGNGKDMLMTVMADITDKVAVEAIPEKIISRFGTVDGIINNAGIMHPFQRFNDLAFDVVERVLNVNLFGAMYMIKTFLPYLIKRPEANITNLSSMAGFLPLPGQSIYCASKAAIKLLTEVLHSEFTDTNVNVTVVMPGGIDTNITKNSGATISEEVIKGNKAYKMVSPARAANIIVEGIERNKQRVLIDTDASFMDCFYRFNPSYAAKFIFNKMKILLPA
jgi:short-subunit dehydrogenase